MKIYLLIFSILFSCNLFALSLKESVGDGWPPIIQSNESYENEKQEKTLAYLNIRNYIWDLLILEDHEFLLKSFNNKMEKEGYSVTPKDVEFYEFVLYLSLLKKYESSSDDLENLYFRMLTYKMFTCMQAYLKIDINNNYVSIAEKVDFGEDFIALLEDLFIVINDDFDNFR